MYSHDRGVALFTLPFFWNPIPFYCLQLTIVRELLPCVSAAYTVSGLVYEVTQIHNECHKEYTRQTQGPVEHRLNTRRMLVVPV